MPSAEYFNNRPEVSDQSYAVFGQIDWKATDTLKVTAGLRYSWDHKYGTESVRLLDFGNIVAPETYRQPSPAAFDLTTLCTVVDCAPTKGVVSKTTYNPVTGLASRSYNATWQDPTATIGLEWTPDPTTLVYAKYGRGYKSGGFNIGIFTVLSFSPYTKAETVDSFEAGVKKTFTNFLTDDGLPDPRCGRLLLRLPEPADPDLHRADLGRAYSVDDGLLQRPDQRLGRHRARSDLDRRSRTWTSCSATPTTTLTRTSGVAADPADPNAIGPGAKPLFTAAQCAAQLAGHHGTPVPGGCTVDIYSVGIAGDANAGWNIPQSLKGQELPNAPRNKLAINALYSWDLGNGMGTMIPSVSYIWRDVQYGAFFQRPWWAAPSWDEWDARVTWKSSNDRVEVILFGKNLANSIGYDQGPVAGRLAEVTNVIGPKPIPAATSVEAPFNYVQGLNGPAGFNQKVRERVPRRPGADAVPDPAVHLRHRGALQVLLTSSVGPLAARRSYQSRAARLGPPVSV